MVPVGLPVIEDGAVLVRGGKIIEVGFFRNLKKETDKIFDHEGAVLVPGLINCHTHLELSFLEDLGRDNSFFTAGDIPAWIYALVHKRAELSDNVATNESLARRTLEKMYHSGVVAAADIGNLGESAAISKNSPVRTLFFLESFGLRAAEISAVENKLAGFNDLSWTGHSLYSTHSELIRRFKMRSLERNDIFPIHIAESAAEVEYLQTGEGPFADFFIKRLSETEADNDPRMDDIFTPPGKGAVAYLADIGCLDAETICVHCVHVDDSEIDLLAESRAAVCLCPGSNQYLGVGKAPAAMFLKKGVRTCLGTDSLASNPQLSLWNEMELIARQNQDIRSEVIFKMATSNGAEVLGIDQNYGTLAPGKKATILAVKGLEAKKDDVYECLVHAGTTPNIDIIEGIYD